MVLGSVAPVPRRLPLRLVSKYSMGFHSADSEQGTIIVLHGVQNWPLFLLT